MRETKAVLAVVVTHNRLELLKKCLDSLVSQTYPCDIFVIDNASDDGTEKCLKQMDDDRVRFYRSENNIGGAGGFQYGIRHGVEEGYSYIWVMDDDCIPSRVALEKLIEADEVLGGPGSYGFLSSAVLWTDGRECMMNRQKIARDAHKKVELIKDGLVSIIQATFVSLFLPTETVRCVGLPYKEYFIWGDDIEYTRRIAIRHKMRSYLAGQSQVVHAMKNNVGSDISADDLSRMPRYRLAVRNEWFTYHKEGLYGICFYHFRCLRSFFRICTKSKDHRLTRLKALFDGMVAGPFFRPKLEYPAGSKKI